MGRKAVTLFPGTQRLLAEMGACLQRARLRRTKLSVELGRTDGDDTPAFCGDGNPPQRLPPK